MNTLILSVLLYCVIRQYTTESDCRRLLPYPCCFNQYLNNASNTCTDCPRGTFGWNCKSTCPSGFFGQVCQSSCVCKASECHHVTGCVKTTATSHEPTKVRGTLHEIRSSPHPDEVTSHEPTMELKTLYQTKSYPHPVEERRGPTVINSDTETLQTLVVIALFLLVLGQIIIIILMSWYILKQTGSASAIKGIDLVPRTGVLSYYQLQASLDRGYTSTGREDQPAASGQRSEYMTTRSLEIAEMSTVDASSLNI